MVSTSGIRLFCAVIAEVPLHDRLHAMCSQPVTAVPAQADVDINCFSSLLRQFRSLCQQTFVSEIFFNRLLQKL